MALKTSGLGLVLPGLGLGLDTVGLVNITAVYYPVLVVPTHRGMARLTGRGRLVLHRDGLLVLTGHPSSY